MKKITSLLLALALITLTPGCAFFRAGSTSQKAADVQRLAQVAATVGTQAALLSNPQYRVAFEVALATLDPAVESGQINGLLLRQILASLPVEKLESQEARIAIVTATMLYDMATADQMNVEMPAYVLAAARGIRNGIRDGLLMSNTTIFKPVKTSMFPQPWLTNTCEISTRTLEYNPERDGRPQVVTLPYIVEPNFNTLK